MKHQHTTIPSWRRLLFIAFPLLGAVIFTLALMLPALAQAVPGQSFTITDIVPISYDFLSPCNGEYVLVSGDGQVVLHFTDDGNGGFHTVQLLDFSNLIGSGTLGNTYHMTGVVRESFNIRVAQEFSRTQTLNFIGEGSAPNLIVHQVQRLTLNPDGTVTIRVDFFSAECRG